MRSQVLVYLLLTVGGLALLHAVMAVLRGRGAGGLFAFLACGAVVSTAAGLWVTRQAIQREAEMSVATGVAWGVGLALGFFACGVAVSAAWLGLVKGVARVVGAVRRGAR